MNKKTENMLLGGLFLFSIGALFYVYNDEQKKENRKKKIDKIKKNINNGFYQDAKNLSRDWNNVYGDLNKSFKKLKENE